MLTVTILTPCHRFSCKGKKRKIIDRNNLLNKFESENYLERRNLLQR